MGIVEGQPLQGSASCSVFFGVSTELTNLIYGSMDAAARHADAALAPPANHLHLAFTLFTLLA